MRIKMIASAQVARGEEVRLTGLTDIRRDVRKLLNEVLPQISVPEGSILEGGRKRRYAQQVDLGRRVGHDNIVETRSGDNIFYAQELNRLGMTRFVMDRKPEPTQLLTVVLLWNESGFYEIVTAFEGQLAPKEPWDEYAEPNSREFWDSHAIVWGRQKIVDFSITKNCPW